MGTCGNVIAIALDTGADVTHAAGGKAAGSGAIFPRNEREVQTDQIKLVALHVLQACVNVFQAMRAVPEMGWSHLAMWPMCTACPCVRHVGGQCWRETRIVFAI